VFTPTRNLSSSSRTVKILKVSKAWRESAGKNEADNVVVLWWRAIACSVDEDLSSKYLVSMTSVTDVLIAEDIDPEHV
jgi:hypothetical protein